MKRIFFLIVVLIFLIGNAYSQDWKIKLDSALTVMSNQNTFDGQVLLAEKGNILFHNSYGQIENEAGKPEITNSTPFKVYSVGKSFTANSILLLVQEGKLSLGDPLTKFFPEFPYSNITIRNLLNMTSGLPRFLPIALKHGNPNIIMTNEDLLSLVTKHPPKSGIPGDQFFYNNANYNLLGSIVEKVSGRSFKTFIEERILNPLNMSNTFDGTQIEINRIRKEGVNSDNFIQTLGAGSIYTTAQDLYLYDQALRNNKLIKAELQTKAYEMTKLNNDSLSNYGFGWRINEDPQEGLVVSHVGDGTNMWAGFQRFLDSKKTIIIIHAFSNEYHNQVYQAIRNIWEGKAFELPVKRIKYDIDKALFEKYVGVYESPNFGKIHISTSDGKLYLRPDPIPGKEELVPSSDTTFYFKDQNLEWEFYLNQDGTVKGFGIKDTPQMMGLKVEENQK